MLKDIYSRWPVEYGRLPSRTRACIHQKAYRLGLTNRSQVAPSFDHVAPEAWAYLAGFFDGEGTVWWNEGIRSSSRAGYHQALVHVCNTHRPTMDWIAETWPGGSWSRRAPQFSATLNCMGTLPLYTYRWVRTSLVIEVLTGMMPYLVTKKEKAMNVLDIVAERTKFNALT